MYDPDHLKGIRSNFDHAINECYYYKRDAPTKVFGGFSALGCPGSAWHPIFRDTRVEVYEASLPYLKIYAEEAGMAGAKCCSVIDRVLIRPPGIITSGEEWHRDIGSTKFLPKGGKLAFFGGWVNLDDTPQYFKCTPYSHAAINPTTSVSEVIDVRDMEDGFSKIPKKEHIDFENASEVIEIPPGSAIIFHQHIGHTIIKSKSKHKIYRLFQGFIVSNSPEFKEFVYGGEEQLQINASTQSVPLLPGGTQWPIYSHMHSIFKTKTFRILPDHKPTNRMIPPENLEGNYRKIFKDEVVDAILVQRFLPNMDTLSRIPGVHKFPEVEEKDIDIFRPRIL